MSRTDSKYRKKPMTVSRIRATMTRVQRYHVRGNFLGVVNWVCPVCGLINQTRLMQKHYRLECKGGCRATYIPALRLLLIPRGHRYRVPPDFIIPDEQGETAIQEAFPMGDMGYWHMGGCVHSVEIIEEVTP